MRTKKNQQEKKFLLNCSHWNTKKYIYKVFRVHDSSINFIELKEKNL